MPTINLTEKKAFPSAFGYAKGLRGGWDSGTIIEVTNTNDSGVGSLRWALTQTYPRIILVRVSGLVNLTSTLQNANSNEDYVLIGQTAVGGGLTVTGRPLELAASNSIYRFLTVRTNYTGGTAGIEDSVSLVNSGSARSLQTYIDHFSISFGNDEILSIRGYDGNSLVTSAYNLMGEPHPDHTRGGIYGSKLPSGQNTVDSGNYTHALNMYKDVGARFPNWNGEGILENYMNVVSNWQGRMMRWNGNALIDWMNNAHYSGNMAKGATADPLPFNKFAYESVSRSGSSRIFAELNWFDQYKTLPDTNDENFFQYFYNQGGKTEGNQVESQFFVDSRQGNGELPSFGMLSAQDAAQHVFNHVGNCYGSDANGDPVLRRDALDQEYIDDTVNDTSSSSYKTTGSWSVATPSSATQYSDTTVQHLPDAWVAQHGITSVDQIKNTYVFDDYTVNNQAGYSALEIFCAYVAGDFIRMSNQSTVTATPSQIQEALALIIGA